LLAVGRNGAGKTNLLEAIHVGTQGFSPRSRNDSQLVRFGAEAARIELAGSRAGSQLEIEITLRRRSTFLLDAFGDTAIREPRAGLSGTGPFYVTNDTGTEIEMRANERYYGGKPAIDRILERHGIPPDPHAALRHPALPAACRELAAMALRHFDEAGRAMARCSRRAMRPAAVMGAFYRANLDALLAADWRDPSARVSLSTSRKLWLVLRHGLI
jgi:hypothetical protein